MTTPPTPAPHVADAGPGASIVRLPADLRGAALLSLRSALASAARAGHDVDVDCEGARTLSAKVLAVLVAATRMARTRGVHVRLVNVDAARAASIRRHGLHHSLTIGVAEAA